MATSRAAGWPTDGPTASQLKEFFTQIGEGLITKERLQPFLRPTSGGPQLYPYMDILELGLGVRSFNCLKRVGIETIGDLIEKTEADLSQIPNMGRKPIEEIKEMLARKGLALKNELVPNMPALDVKSVVNHLFELCKLLDEKIDLTHKIAEHHEMEKRWAAEEASGSWGGEVAGPEMRASHHRDAERISDELSVTSAAIDTTRLELAGMLVEGDFGN